MVRTPPDHVPLGVDAPFVTQGTVFFTISQHSQHCYILVVYFSLSFFAFIVLKNKIIEGTVYYKNSFVKTRIPGKTYSRGNYLEKDLDLS